MIYGIDMQIRQINEDEKAVELFEKYMPGMLKMASMNKEAGGLSIRMLAKYMNGAISDEVLETLDRELKALGVENGGISPAEKERIKLYQQIAAKDAAKGEEEESFCNQEVKPGEVWRDTRGKRIEAHAGGMLYENETYYWYGENKEHTDGKSHIWTWGIRMYASKDFYNWTDLGLIIPPVLDNPNSDLFPEKRVDRPHIIKNEKTGKYVCWLKLCGASANFAVLTADQLTGPYDLVKEQYNPFGMNIGDFDISVDPDTKNAYLYCEAEHDMVVGIRLNDAYTEGVEIVSKQYEHLHAPFCREGVTVFRRNDKLYMLTSGMTGYIPNQSDSAVSAGYEKPFESIGDPHVNDASMASFNSQIGQVFQVPGKKDLYVTIADRWVPDYVVDYKRADILRRAIASNHNPEKYQVTDQEKEELMKAPMLESANTHLATYVLLPIRFENEKPMIDWKDSWKLEDYE